VNEDIQILILYIIHILEMNIFYVNNILKVHIMCKNVRYGFSYTIQI